MSNGEFQMPRKFTFDEFYEMLKEFVNDPKVRELLATYDAEDALGRGDLLDGSQCSDLAFESYSDFKIAGWNILSSGDSILNSIRPLSVRFRWPTRRWQQARHLGVLV